MLLFDKNIATTVWIGKQFTEPTTGIAVDPTSGTCDIWDLNTATPIVTLTLSKFDSKTGYYGDDLDITSYNEGTYQLRFNFVYAGNDYPMDETMVIADSILAEHAYLDQYVSRAGQGNGSNQILWHSNDANGDPVAGVQVYITSDIDGNTAITADQYSQSDGITTWWLPVGTYYVWQTKSGNSWSNPETLTVV